MERTGTRSALRPIVTTYLVVGLVIGVYVTLVEPGGPMEPGLEGLLRDAVTIGLHTLLWPLFLFGGLDVRLR